jgi:hypothetical protein
VSFKVYATGRARVLLEKRKNVHAFVIGDFEEGEKFLSEHRMPSPAYFISKGYQYVRYNPYIYDYFFYSCNEEKIIEAKDVLLYENKILVR